MTSGPDVGGCITDVAGVAVGHHTDAHGGTGCTVVLLEEGAVGAVDVRGALPGTQDTDSLALTSREIPVHAVLLTGGSNLGLGAAAGVAQFLHERGLGLATGSIVVPRVPTAVVFDLGVGRRDVWPGPQDAYAACCAASADRADTGSVGVGTGATVGKLLGVSRAVKGGFGVAAVQLDGGATVGAAVAVNPIGGVYDHRTGDLAAGPLDEKRQRLVDPVVAVLSRGYRAPAWLEGANTVIGVVATNADIGRTGADRLARMGHDGLALAVRPAHTAFDGDTMFAVATGRIPWRGATIALEAAAATVTARAVLEAVRAAASLHGIPAASDCLRPM